MTDTWNNPTLSGHLIRDHERIVSALHSTATSKSKSVRKTQLPDPETLSAEVNTLQKSIDNISLKSFRFCFYHNNGDQLNDPQTGRRCRSVYAYIDEFGLQCPDQHREYVHVFIHPQSPKIFLKKCASNSDSVEMSPEGVAIFSVHDKVPWGPSYVTRTSQHALLCSQTLHDLYDRIPCISKQLPTDNQCLICIEGRAFSYRSEGDYAE